MTIFLHIPKTGGTTCIKNIQIKSANQFKHYHTYSKITAEDSVPFLFTNPEKYKNNNIFTLIRKPLERLYSLYYFLSGAVTSSFMLFCPKNYSIDTSFENFIHKNKNNTLQFLSGVRNPTENTLKNIINTIEDLNIITGITEFYENSLNLFEYFSDVTFPLTIQNKRQCLFDKKSISTGQLKLFEELNVLDIQLYKYCLKRFEKLKQQVPLSNFQCLKENKYNNIDIQNNRYTLSNCLILSNIFKNNNKKKLVEIDLNAGKSTKQNKDLLELWVTLFIKEFNIKIQKNKIKENPLKIIQDLFYGA